MALLCSASTAISDYSKRQSIDQTWRVETKIAALTLAPIARFLVVSAPHSGNWIHVLQSQSRGAVFVSIMSPPVSLWLGCLLCEPHQHQWPFGAKGDEFGSQDIIIPAKKRTISSSLQTHWLHLESIAGIMILHRLNTDWSNTKVANRIDYHAPTLNRTSPVHRPKPMRQQWPKLYAMRPCTPRSTMIIIVTIGLWKSYKLEECCILSELEHCITTALLYWRCSWELLRIPTNFNRNTTVHTVDTDS
jgi:hypothetical protein